MKTLELAAASNDVEPVRRLARALGGTLYFDPRSEEHSLPFRALLTVVTDDLGALLAAADVGAWVICRRVIRPRPEPTDARATATALLPGVIALYPMVRNPDLSHEQADRHWRDLHAPLALRHHAGMSHYTQLSIVQRLQGPGWDGFALCGFPSLEDLRERFYDDDQGRAAIRADVARFADPSRSPRRLLATEEGYRLPS